MRYTPILKTKAAEYFSLKNLDDSQKQQILPLLEVPNIPWDFIKEAPSKNVDEYLKDIIPSIKDSWGALPVILDIDETLQSEKNSKGQYCIDCLVEQGKEQGLYIIPTVAMRRSPTYTNAIRKILKSNQSDVCLRLGIEDSESTNLEEDILSFMDMLGVKADNVYLVVDLRDIAPTDEEMLAPAVAQILRNLPEIHRWKEVIFAATAFPKDLSGCRSNSITRIRRTEWNVWKRLAEMDELPRVPSFGDYAIAHPEINELDPRTMTMTAQIRYTSDLDFLILKGRSVKHHGFEQFFSLSDTLLAMKEFAGKDFSVGDNMLYECSSKKEKTGNATTWRKIALTHHIAVVLSQLDSLSDV